MNLGSLSINQPILAMVLSIVLLIVGAIAYTTLPVSEYPQVVPPTVVVTTQYPGATAQTVSDTVAAPIEQEINGVEDMLYLYSQATSNGNLTITVTFKLGTDLDKAQVLVQNRVAIAQPRLPEEVQRNGVVTRKNSPDILMVVFMLSPDDSFDQLYISNYALLQVRDELLRLDGIGDIQMFGARDYSMRLWLDPDRIATLGLTSAEVVAAIRAQNLQITGGQIGEPPIADRAFQPNLTFTGRLKDQKQFEDIVVRAGADGRTVRLRDVARVELGALSYSTNSFLLRKSAVGLLVTQRPGSNALATAKNISDAMVKLKASFPKGLDYNIGYNPTEFIAQSVHELIKTIYEAMLLVVIVVLVFLQGWRPAIIPIVAIPVSLVGTFAVMAALGFSINNLTLFGLVLAVGIVVDDAIVVVENVERHLEHGLSRRDAALKTMEEVGGALVSIALVLCAVFVPTAFLGGISGQFFQQFAVTIAVATAISCFCSLTLSPALASLILRPREDKRPPASWNFIARGWDTFTGYFNRGFDRLSHGYARLADFVIRHSVVMLLVYVVLIGSAGWLIATTPQGFIPAQDRGYVIISAQLPGAASLARTTDIVRQIEKTALDTPGIIRVAAFAGFSGATRTQAGNAAALVSGVRGAGSAAEERSDRGGDHCRSAQAPVRDSGGLHHRHSAAAGAGHRHRRRFHDAHPGSPGPRTRTAGSRQRRACCRRAQGARIDAGILALHRQYAAGVRRYRSRQGAETRRADCERQRNHPDLFRLDLCQRLQPVWPHLSRHRAGRPAIPQGDVRFGAAAHPQCRGRHGDARQRGGFPRRFRPRPRRALQSLSGGGAAGRSVAGNEFDDRHQHHEAAGGPDLAERVLL